MQAAETHTHPVVERTQARDDRRAALLVGRFHSRLFYRYPQAQLCFPKDVERYTREVQPLFGDLIQRLEDPSKLGQAIHCFILTYSQLTTKPAILKVFGEVLVETVSDFAGPQWRDRYFESTGLIFHHYLQRVMKEKGVDISQLGEGTPFPASPKRARPPRHQPSKDARARRKRTGDITLPPGFNPDDSQLPAGIRPRRPSRRTGSITRPPLDTNRPSVEVRPRRRQTGDVTRPSPRRRGDVTRPPEAQKPAEATERKTRSEFEGAAHYFSRGEEMLRREQPRKALEAYKEAMRCEPERLKYKLHYTWAAFCCGRLPQQELLKVLSKIFYNLDPEDTQQRLDRAQVYLLLGRLAKASGEEETAFDYFQSAASDDPGCIEAKREERLYHMRQNKEANQSWLDKLLRKGE